MSRRLMSLTPELVARVHRQVEDLGPAPGGSYLGDEDYAALVENALSGRAIDEPIWLFAYGSLIWRPEIEHVEERAATVHGWHRCFCMKLTRWRGTPENPGLMLALERGGACRGIAMLLPAGHPGKQLDRLFRREMTYKPSSYIPRWLPAVTTAGPVRAIGFVINRKGMAYSGPLSEAERVKLMASGCGHVGSCADYLYNTVANLEARGIHDRYLWRLQQLVAAEIEARANGGFATAPAG